MRIQTIELRPARKEDLEFLYELRKDTYKEYIEKIWGWDEELQRNNSMFGKRFNPKKYLIITKSGQKVGCIGIINTRLSMYFHHFFISPKFQDRGIGTYILRKLIWKSIKKEKDLLLQVIKINKRAQNLYFRLGFVIVGENEEHFNMKYNKEFQQKRSILNKNLCENSQKIEEI